MIKNKLIEEYLEYSMMKVIHCIGIENKNSAGSLLTHVAKLNSVGVKIISSEPNSSQKQLTNMKQ